MASLPLTSANATRSSQARRSNYSIIPSFARRDLRRSRKDPFAESNRYYEFMGWNMMLWYSVREESYARVVLRSGGHNFGMRLAACATMIVCLRRIGIPAAGASR
ncbi:hypothetical protein L207DRAFT_578652 [Hyaloscypha variabilis F]|uniref:Uncharacterized protein n=1 Tax=Hyaloscypha variabilis (strain UAMH 11265 / GT02V1 / F) TaxID=1149755 RepID=A0A2J6S4Q5_HYAVF|nr:hypothetical protein L207DRAFT_578652 [Hyaloscypha variabilis F]